MTSQPRRPGVNICLSWVKAANGEIPPEAVSAAEDQDQQSTLSPNLCFQIKASKRYVARFLHNGVLLPGQVKEGQNCVAIYRDCQKSSSECQVRVESQEYQVLCKTPIKPGNRQDYQWMGCKGHTVPNYALIGGSDLGKPLYVARAKVKGAWRLGKFLPEDGTAYFTHGKNVVTRDRDDQFQVLILPNFYNFTHASYR